MSELRAIFRADLDKPGRPVLLLTRELVIQARQQVTVAPITGTVRGLSSEVLVGPENGLDKPGAVNVDSTTTVPLSRLRGQVGFLLAHQEADLARAIRCAFDLPAL